MQTKTITEPEHIYLDLEGNKIKRTPKDFPQSYDEHVIWSKEYDEERSRRLCSIKLKTQYKETYKSVSMAVFENIGEFYDNRSPESIERFLKKLLNKELKLTAITKSCNISNGHHYWCFLYEDLIK